MVVNIIKALVEATVSWKVFLQIHKRRGLKSLDS